MRGLLLRGQALRASYHTLKFTLVQRTPAVLLIGDFIFQIAVLKSKGKKYFPANAFGAIAGGLGRPGSIRFRAALVEQIR
jgi:hypothetical protein